MTTNLGKNEPSDSTPEVVHVSVFGSDDVQRQPFTAGRTVGQYLANAGITVERGQTVSLNGQTTTLDTIVESSPDTVNAIVVTSRVANGRL